MTTVSRASRPPDSRFRAVRWRPLVRRAGLYVLLIVGSLVFIYPFLWMVATSLRSVAGVGRSGISIWPNELLWNNYYLAMTEFPFWQYAINSLWTTVLPVIGTVFSCSIAGFAFARMRAPWSGLLFAVVLSTMLLPWEVTLVPQYILFSRLGLVDTLYPLIVPAFFGAPFYIFLFRQFFRRMPDYLADAALIDGCSWPRIFWSIYLPNARPAVVAVSVLLFIGYWNNFIGPAIYITSDKWKTLPLGLAGFQAQNASGGRLTGGSTDTPLLMATSILIAIPCIVLYFLAQRSFREGLTFSGSNG